MEGPCGTKGDLNSKYVEEVLKLYAYSWTNLEIVRLVTTELVDESNTFDDWDLDQAFNPYFINHILS